MAISDVFLWHLLLSPAPEDPPCFTSKIGQGFTHLPPQPPPRATASDLFLRVQGTRCPCHCERSSLSHLDPSRRFQRALLLRLPVSFLPRQSPRRPGHSCSRQTCPALLLLPHGLCAAAILSQLSCFPRFPRQLSVLAVSCCSPATCPLTHPALSAPYGESAAVIQVTRRPPVSPGSLPPFGIGC